MTDKKLFENISNHLLNDEKPSIYLNEIYDSDEFSKYPFDMLKQLKSTEQSPKFHPEGNVWIHTMMVVDECSNIKGKSKDSLALMWSALLHDLGKPKTTKMKKDRLTSYDHDKTGAKLAQQFLQCFTDDQDFINRVCKLVRYHMHILFVVKDLPFGDKKSILNDTNIDELALLGLADRLGRGNIDIDEEKLNIQKFLEKIYE